MRPSEVWPRNEPVFPEIKRIKRTGKRGWRVAGTGTEKNCEDSGVGEGSRASLQTPERARSPHGKPVMNAESGFSGARTPISTLLVGQTSKADLESYLSLTPRISGAR